MQENVTSLNPIRDHQNRHAREKQQYRNNSSRHWPRRFAQRQIFLRFGPCLEARYFAGCLCASLWFRGYACTSHLAVISAVDLVNGHGRGLGLAHRLESGSIANEKALGVRRKVIESTELRHHEPSSKIRLGSRACFLGDTGIGAGRHCGAIRFSPKNSSGVHWTVHSLGLTQTRPAAGKQGGYGLAVTCHWRKCS